MEFFTVGVYNSSEEVFFRKLVDNGIDLFCDIRKRRGVRGKKYAFVNSLRLQEKLNELSIDYTHVIELAPSTEIREIQKNDDSKLKASKRDRILLGDNFISAYEETIIKKFDFDKFINESQKNNKQKIVLFCVEETPKACHRSIVASKLEKLGYMITHL